MDVHIANGGDRGKATAWEQAKRAALRSTGIKPGTVTTATDTGPILSADEAQMQQFIDTMFKRCIGVQGWIALRAFEHEREGGPVVNRWVPFDKEMVPAAIEAATAVAQRTGAQRAVFSPPVAVFGEKRNDKGELFGGEANVVCAPAIAVELDARPQESLDTLTKVLGPPTLTVASGGLWQGQPKLHAYWRLGEPATTPETMEALKTARRIAARLVDSDVTAVALSHPMRWPGSWHTKGEPVLCRIVGGDPTRDIKLTWAVEALDAALLEAGLELDGRGTLAQAERKGFKTEREWPAEDLDRAADTIPNPDLRWDDWNITGMAFYDASHGSPDGLEAFIRWSEKSDKGDAEAAERRWKHYSASPPTDISAGKLIHLARMADADFTPNRLSAEDWFEPIDETAEPLFPVEKPDAYVLRATPFVVKDPSTLPRRQWLYGNHYIRKYVSTTSAPSAVGKSSFTMIEALAMVTGKPLLGVDPKGVFRVWLWNGEDPYEELELRLHAAMQHYGLTEADIGGRLFVDSGREQEIIIAVQERGGVKVQVPVVNAVISMFQQNRIDVGVLDPFVSTYIGAETNELFDPAVKKWGAIAGACNAAIELVHHTRKLNGAETTVEDIRGGGALVAGARSKRVLAGMTAAEEKKFGVGENQHRRFFRIADARVNMALPAVSSTEWYEMKTVVLPNGDGDSPVDRMMNGEAVGVATVRQLRANESTLSTDAVDKIVEAIEAGEWRESVQASAWVGHAVADALGLDVLENKPLIRDVLAELRRTNVIRIEQRTNEKKNKVAYVVVSAASKMPRDMDKMSDNPFD